MNGFLCQKDGPGFTFSCLNTGLLKPEEFDSCPEEFNSNISTRNQKASALAFVTNLYRGEWNMGLGFYCLSSSHLPLHPTILLWTYLHECSEIAHHHSEHSNRIGIWFPASPVVNNNLLPKISLSFRVRKASGLTLSRFNYHVLFCVARYLNWGSSGGKGDDKNSV